ncbi:MAG: hypothetical protein BGO67_05650 [Alphaproteobacteria bacterium 41-28]|nr:MAG: hypothetical protein BGO67_05650 [Alphaproteobacteria bacterium 41-28]
MSKIAFKNPKGNTIYWTKLGFDWGAFWGALLLAGLPFFLRRMNTFGAYFLGLALIDTIGACLENLSKEPSGFIYSMIALDLGLALYFGIRGGKLTARHYLEEGYEFHTKDKDLIVLAKNKWDLNT